MSIECDGEVIWCIWRSLDTGQFTVSALSVNSGKWSICIQDDKTSILDNISRLEITPREHYLNLIFYPGAFSLEEIAKVLSVSLILIEGLLVSFLTFASLANC